MVRDGKEAILGWNIDKEGVLEDKGSVGSQLLQVERSLEVVLDERKVVMAEKDLEVVELLQFEEPLMFCLRVHSSNAHLKEIDCE